LVEVDDAVSIGVEKAALLGFGAASRTAVQKHDRFARGIAAFLEMDFVDRRDP
jgi:hypothetical protein